MLIVTVAGLLSWTITRRFRRKWSFLALLLVSFPVSMIVIDDVRTCGVVVEVTGSEIDPVYSIVYYNSTALFPFVLQMHHNWTARMFIYKILLLNQDGFIVSQTSPNHDQSEIRRWEEFTISVALCFQGFLLAILSILGVESIIKWRKPI